MTYFLQQRAKMTGYVIPFSILLVAFFFGLSCCSHCENETGYPLTVLVRKFPDPLIIKKEEKFDVSATVRVTRKLPSKFLVDLDLWRKAGFWFKIPCIKNVGSCDYVVDCNKLNCTQILNMCTKCRIAVDDVTVTVPVNVDMPSFIVNGKYWVGYKLYDSKNKKHPVACGEQYFNIEI